MHATLELVAERISVTAGAPVESIGAATRLKDLALDSFLMVEMAVDLQEEFDAIFTQEDLRSVVTVGDLVELLNASRPSPASTRSSSSASASPSRSRWTPP